jgi:hypothetical protein
MTQLHSTYQTLSRLSSALLILLWSYAALSKLAAYPNFHSELMGHELIRSYADTLTWLVPFIELIIVFLLIIKQNQLPGLLLSLALLLLFTVYIVYMFMVYPHTPCSCGGVISLLTWKEHIIFNLCFIFIALIGLATDQRIKNYSIYR